MAESREAPGLPHRSSPPTLTAYQRRLFIFLGVATFFEGYDFLALSQVLPNLRADFGLSDAAGGRLVAAISLGTILSYAVVRLADRVGRRPTMMVTIVGYAGFTFLSGLARGPYDFAVYQLLARVFLIAEWALSMVYAAEEFPAARRGTAMGILQAVTALGSIVCAAVVPYLLRTPFGWRAVYLVGVLPLLVIAYARRGLHETERFNAYRVTAPAPRALTAIFRSPYRRRVLQLAAIWGLTYLCTQNAVVFWKEFVVAERGFTDLDVGRALPIASLVSLPLIFAFARLIDRWGRRRSAAIVYVLLAGSVLGAYGFHSRVGLTASLAVAIFAVGAQPGVLNAFTTELVPTGLRADAFAWSNNLLGRVGYVIGPAIVGAAAQRVGWGTAVSWTAVPALLALVLILTFLPETTGRTLEEASRL